MKKTRLSRAYRALLWVGFTTCALSACTGAEQQAQQSGNRPITVTTAPVEAEIVTGHRQYPANVVPLQETELRAEVNGYITNIHVADGASVRAGQPLYDIDHTRFDAALVQAKANQAIAEANYARVQRDLKRYEVLAEKDAIARQTLDNARTELQNAAAQKEVAEAAVTTATINRDRSVIRAPFAGIIGISQVRIGTLVSAGSTLINTISATSPIAVEFQVNENDLADIIELQRQGNTVRDSVITLQLGDGSEYSHFGTVAAIDRAVNRQTGTITVRAKFDNPAGRLRAGMSTILRIRRQSASEQLVIPYRAVTEQLSQSMVYVVGDSNRVDQRIVRLGMKSGENVVVEDGLTKGEIIVTDGLINLRQGAIVTTEGTNPR